MFGVVALGVGVGTVMGLRYKPNNDDAKDICPSNVNCTAKQVDANDRLVEGARTQCAWMYVGFRVGALSLAGAAALYIFDKPTNTSSSWQAVPAVGRGEVGASVVGTFWVVAELTQNVCTAQRPTRGMSRPYACEAERRFRHAVCRGRLLRRVARAAVG